MSNFELKSLKRDSFGKKVNLIREEGNIPAVVYGKELENSFIQINYVEFDKLFLKSGYSSLIDLKINDQESIKVLVKEVSYHPVTRKIEHIDFYKVRMDEKVQAKVDLTYVGESSFMKEYGGSLVKNMSSVVIECLPEDLLAGIEVDISKIKQAEDNIKVKDLPISEKVIILQNGEEVVASVVVRMKQNLVTDKPAEATTEEGAASDGEEKSEDKKEDKK